MAMASTSFHLNPLTSKKRKRSSVKVAPAPAKWCGDGAANAYSTRLLDALRRVPTPSGGGPGRCRAVREAADRTLAAVARGRTCWSRAILLQTRSRRALRPKRRRDSPSELGKPALERKARVLGRLVPGGRTLPFPALLEETCDYIAALEMQVRAMAALARALVAATGGSPATTA